MSDADMIAWAEGLFVGSLSSDEIAAFDREVEAGRARRSYEGAGGLLGLAKVKILSSKEKS